MRYCCTCEMAGGVMTGTDDIDAHVPADARRVLVLQGGGALGSYQAGVFQALDEGGFCPEWIAGISIGAINGALIAGNPPERRLERLTEFWKLVTSGVLAMVPAPEMGFRRHWHEMAAAFTAVGGAPGFFRPMWPPVLPWLKGPLGYYDTQPLKATLERLVDWDLLNSGLVRLSVGAVNVETGNFRYFDTARERLGPEHIMASGALPPGFAPVEIEGQHWWDGGLVSNTPLDFVLETASRRDLLIFQVDLFPARGSLPETINEAEERVSDIRFSSRTRMNTDANVKMDNLRAALARLIEGLPDDMRDSEDARLLARAARQSRVAIGQLIYRDKPWQGNAKGREFSRATMAEHWAAGCEDVQAGLRHAAWLRQPMPLGATSHDMTIEAADGEAARMETRK
jgi:NTE family protein